MAQLIQATRSIRTALLEGAHLTTAEMNRIGQTVDARKIVSRLRKQFDISDYWLHTDGRRYKRYYCPGWVVSPATRVLPGTRVLPSTRNDREGNGFF